MSRQRRYLGVFCEREDPQLASPEVLFADTRDLMRPAPRRGAAPPELGGAVALEPAPELGLRPVESELIHRLGPVRKREYWAYDALVVSDQEPTHRMLGRSDVVQDDPRRDPQEQLLLRLDLSQQPVFEIGEGRL